MPRGSVKQRLADLKVSPQKRRGQNFVIDQALTAAIIEFGRPQEAGHLIEIGPGLGALTQLLGRYAPLSVVEIEPGLCRDLRRRFPQIEVIEADIREVAFERWGKELVVFGNLPYAFSTEILFHLIDHAACIKRAVLLLQREFAARLAAAPGGRDYGVLSISCQLWSEVKLGPVFSGAAFYPPAKVESQLVELVFFPKPRFLIPDLVLFKMAVRAAFSQRRKKLSNSLEASGLFSKEKVAKALAAARIDGGRRAESLSIEEYADLTGALSGNP